MKKSTAFGIATAVTVAVAVALAIFHFNRFILEEEGILGLVVAIVLLGAPCAVASIFGIVFDAEMEGNTQDVELWKVSLGVTIIIPVICLLGLEREWPKKWDVDPIWFIDVLFGLPLLINYIFSLWATFSTPESRRHYYPSPIDTTPTTTSTTTETDAYGRPTGRPF